ncbi:hypothetical protein MLD38_011389 [Melastoma candidum]|uniref:Uncharacterized protein n=1 Tax=Melastoma candidum TaxID=119954 RepID=A0ACB9R2X4_9MYRT|nr:hypothetical protein MLD38_011389 [Melastoma candidum]
MKWVSLFLPWILFWDHASSASSAGSCSGDCGDSVKFALGEENLGLWKSGISAVSSPAPGPPADEPHGTLVLAANRTDRSDILKGFRHYHGGWSFSNRHYWASVGFTGSFGFILAILWFFFFGVALLVHLCWGWKMKISEERTHNSQKICLMMLIIFTCAAAIGCILLSVGQDNFHGEVMHTITFVVNQSDYTVETLLNVTDYLSLAKTISVAQVFLPRNVMDDIDKLSSDLSSAAHGLSEKTRDSSSNIRKVFNVVRSTLIAVAAVMLLLSLIGLLCAVLGYRNAIYIFVVSGWILVAVTFVLCGVFVIFSNAISDACLVMDQWVENPHTESALSDILPCVDQNTTNHTLVQSKQVINDIVNVVNHFIYTYANTYPAPSNPYSYNQSGPSMPPLCYPFDSQLNDRQCATQEVSILNASLVWKNYTCEVSASGQCITPGRITPNIYVQLIGAVNESYALEHYTPPLLRLQSCEFVKETFQEITSHYCPPLESHLRMVNAGLGLISIGVLLCFVLWILYANRPQREEVFVKKLFPMLKKIGCFKSSL